MVLTAVPMADSSGGGSGLAFFIPLLLIVGLFVLMNRSQRRQRQRQAETVARLVPGTKVITTSGMAGTVEAVEDEFVVLEVAPGVSTRFVKQAIGRVLDDSDAAVGNSTGNSTDNSDGDTAADDA